MPPIFDDQEEEVVSEGVSGGILASAPDVADETLPAPSTATPALRRSNRQRKQTEFFQSG